MLGPGLALTVRSTRPPPNTSMVLAMPLMPAGLPVALSTTELAPKRT